MQHQKQHATQEKFGARVVRHRYLAISSRYSLHANTSGTVRRTVSSSMGVSQMWDVAVKEPTTRRRGKVPQVSHQRQTSWSSQLSVACHFHIVVRSRATGCMELRSLQIRWLRAKKWMQWFMIKTERCKSGKSQPKKALNMPLVWMCRPAASNFQTHIGLLTSY